MKVSAALIVFVLITIPTEAFEESVKTTKMDLQGTWALEEVQVTGEEDTKRLSENMKGMKVTFSEAKLTVRVGGEDQKGS